MKAVRLGMVGENRGSQFKARSGKKLARPHLNKPGNCGAHLLPTTWKIVGRRIMV
jgi:hypothetical protein